jgi:hypothetical protein
MPRLKEDICQYHSASAAYSYFFDIQPTLYNLSNWQRRYITHFSLQTLSVAQNTPCLMARGLVSDELERMWREAILTRLQLPGAAEENNKEPQYE